MPLRRVMLTRFVSAVMVNVMLRWNQRNVIGIGQAEGAEQ